MPPSAKSTGAAKRSSWRIPKIVLATIGVAWLAAMLFLLVLVVAILRGGQQGLVGTLFERAALELLQRDARALEKALADAGLDSGSGGLEFNLRGQQQFAGEGRNGTSGPASAGLPDDDAGLLAADVNADTADGDADGVDIRV